MKADRFEPVVVDDDHDASSAGRALVVISTKRDQLVILTAVTRPLQLSGLDQTLGLHPSMADAFTAMTQD
ncbi:Anti-anti-sigma regulatory factor (antagonist of anti-sigma factor) [Gordonia terrae C-6]|uniref:Anti-anti-sigma regulatory factor (Antagonist of anti-sigma factor) n=1 Tax=Gordonia terrae C-6 TaxID=1316928 RepID=R7Y6D4_9ACTN|nr:hypothetical protein [Gordonia terrae]EON31214.1 Anti-anti-sigma regulatory factor (antagonist of anti-sigma factor) [Gordonia terrae C-6]